MRLIALCRFSLWCLLAFSCVDSQKAAQPVSLFRLLDHRHTGIDFENNLDYTETVNTYTFKSFYNGGGVGLADFDNDSLLDIFFTGNLVSNQLYRNKGGLQFEDITRPAGLESRGSWSTGVSIVDINSDGWLDIYICKSGPPSGEKRHNELFINNGDLTFTEKAKEFKLDFVGLSTHAAFFDYDRDGDLDCYLLNNSIRSIGSYDLRKDQRNVPDPAGGNKLLRNDGNTFTDVSESAGIYNSMIGFGLGVTIGDVNKDGWPDIYVSNDFFERDYLYVNNKDGTFIESLEGMVREISLGSMGADMADINNDGLPEIFVTEMLPESDDRLKTTTQFETWDKYMTAVKQGYYHQFSRNVLQVNNGNGTFSEISRLAGVHATDWSWGALIFDMDNDGNKDIFVANGIYKDLLDQDYVNFVSNREMVRDILTRKGEVIKQLIDSIPVNKIPNFAFRNNGNLSFTNLAHSWGLGAPTHSNGSAYGDLDNDGDLDLVLNNVNMPAYVYENQLEKTFPDHSYLSVSLHGRGLNNFAIGSKVTLSVGNKIFYQEHFPSRGFMSSVDHKINFGLGKAEMIDSVRVVWPDGTVSVKTNVKGNQTIHVNQDNATAVPDFPVTKFAASIFHETILPDVNFKHSENDFVDFDRDRLLFNMISNEGPCLCDGDVNGDGLDDFYIGGAKNQAGSLFVQHPSGTFYRMSQKTFDADSASEDTDCVFFDADGDGELDLYVASGGNEFSGTAPALLDRLYFNAGKNNFRKAKQLLPSSRTFESTSTVKAADFDLDGDTDLFVGVRVSPGLYGVPCNGYLLLNDGYGNFRDATAEVAPGLRNIGMITDAQWTDINRDSLPDLLVVGEWMEIKVFENQKGKTLTEKNAGFKNTNGWYHAVATADFNGDGWVDIVAGNHGLNSRFKASEKEPLQMYINDFDQNGTVEHITTRYYDGKSLPMVLRQDLVAQLPVLKKKYLYYDSYKGQGMSDIFTAEQMARAVTLNAYDMETSVWLNNGDGTFRKTELPKEAQISPVYAIFVDDIDGDSHADILFGGNLYRAKPETGIYDGSYGVLLKGNGRGGFTTVPVTSSGLSVKGEIRAFRKIMNKDRILMIGINNSRMKFYKY